MSLSHFSIKRPIAVSALIVALIFLGVNSWRKMGLELMPKTDIPYVTVVTTYAGASPSEIETDIAKKIEDAVSTLDGLKHVQSVAMENVCQTIMEFDLAVDVDVAAADVRDKVDQILNDLPEEAGRPQVIKIDINAMPIITVALTGTNPVGDLYDYADNSLRDRFSVIRGVANVELIGGSKTEVQVLLDREALAARGLTTLDVVDAIRKGVKLIPSGRIQDKGTEVSVKFDADFQNVSDMGTLEVANTPQGRVYLRDVATVTMGPEEERQGAYLNGRSAISIKIVKKADANALEVVSQVKTLVEEMRNGLPGGMDLVWVYDDGVMVRNSYDSTFGDIWQGVALTAVVLLLFLHKISTTIIVAISMPFTIVISMFFIHSFGYTLNVSTMLAIGLSVSLLTANSIVVLESIESRLEAGATPKQAAADGAANVVIAVLGSAGTNMVVFLPIAIMGSLVGLIFRPFAVTSLVVNAVSLFLSFTLTPILASLLLRPGNGAQRGLWGRFSAVWDRVFNTVVDWYGRVLRKLGSSRLLCMAAIGISILLLVHALSIFSGLGMTFTPDVDQGRIAVKLEYPTDMNLAETTKRVKEVEEMLRTRPTLQNMLSTIGKVDSSAGTASEGVYLAGIFLRYVEKTERDFTIFDEIREVRSLLSSLPNVRVTVSTPNASGVQMQAIELQITGEEYDRLDELALRTEAIAKTMPTLRNVDTTVREGKPEIRVRPKRAVLSDLGIAPTALGSVLRGNIEGLTAGTFKAGDRTYDIRVKFSEKLGKEQVKSFLFSGKPGQPILLGTIADVEETTSSAILNRMDKQRVSIFFADPETGVALGDAVAGLTDAAFTGENELPAGYSYRLGGTFEMMGEAASAFAEAAVIAVILTYLVLAAVLESLTAPLLIMSTLPMGLVGIAWALFLTGENLSIFALLGIVMLIGIVVNNAVLLVDAYQKRRRAGDTMGNGILNAVPEFFRPVVMSTVAAVFGMIPMATSTGLGSELRTGIGIASAGGILISAIMTVLVIPLFYLMISPVRRRKTEGGASEEKKTEPVSGQGA